MLDETGTHMIPEWQLHEQHDRDVTGLLTELGFRDSQGRIRKYVGSVFLPAAAKLGHSSLGFETCQCRKDKE